MTFVLRGFSWCFLNFAYPMKNVEKQMCWDNENVMKTPWKQINFFMVNEYFHIQRVFMAHENFEPIKNPWNLYTMKNPGFFSWPIKNPWMLFFLPIKFHGFFTSFLWTFMSCEWFHGPWIWKYSQDFHAFLSIFSWQKPREKAHEKAHEKPLNMSWIYHE